MRNQSKRKAEPLSESYFLPENKKLLTEKIAADMGVLRITDPNCSWYPFMNPVMPSYPQSQYNYPSYPPTVPSFSPFPQPQYVPQHYTQPQFPVQPTYSPQPMFIPSPVQLQPQYIPPQYPSIPVQQQYGAIPIPQYVAEPVITPQPTYWSQPPVTQPQPYEDKSRAIMIYTGPAVSPDMDKDSEEEDESSSTKYSLHLPQTENTNFDTLPEPIPLHEPEDLSKALILYTPPQTVIEDSLLRKKKEDKKKEKEKEKELNQMQYEIIPMSDLEPEPIEIEYTGVPSGDFAITNNDMDFMAM